MKEVLKIIPAILNFFIGIISLMMALKSMLSKSFLPFHEKASGKAWSEIENKLQIVILAIMRVSGLGFLIIGILLTLFPIANYFINSVLIQYSIPVIALIYCIGLFFINYTLYKKTKAETPWRGSVFAIIVLVLSITISIFNLVYFNL